MMTEHTLMSCLKATKREMISTIKDFVDTHGEMWWYKKSKTDCGVTIVAHVDTVWDSLSGTKWEFDPVTKTSREVSTQEIRRRIYFDRKEGVIWSPDGLGADDRAGVFALFYIWDRLPEDIRPNLLFTDFEEKGGQGARAACKENMKELLKTTAFVQFDRKNHEDAVFYNEESKEFRDLVCSFGFKEANGSFSDVSVIGKETETCAVNLSCGYYDQHTKGEHLFVSDLFGSLKNAIQLIQKLQSFGRHWPNVPKKKDYYQRPLHASSCVCQDCLRYARMYEDPDWGGGYCGYGYESYRDSLDKEVEETQRGLFEQQLGQKGLEIYNRLKGQQGRKGKKGKAPHHPQCRCVVCTQRRIRLVVNEHMSDAEKSRLNLPPEPSNGGSVPAKIMGLPPAGLPQNVPADVPPPPPTVPSPPGRDYRSWRDGKWWK